MMITLTTDFGLKDGNVGVMKGVIWGISPHAQIADLSHQIGAQNIAEAALILARSAPYFPAGTVHVVVVDPGVGTARRAIAAQLGDWRFVGPDNGVLTRLLEKMERQRRPVEVFHLDRAQFWRGEVSAVFHGRDIFAPVAAHLANGVPLPELGTRIHDPVRLLLPRPQPTPQGLRGEIIHCDHFGNLSTNINQEDLNLSGPLTVRLNGRAAPGIYRTFGERAPGEALALIGSTGSLILAVVNGSAAQYFEGNLGDAVEVIYG